MLTVRAIGDVSPAFGCDECAGEAVASVLAAASVERLRAENDELRGVLSAIDRAARKQKPTDAGWKHVFAALAAHDDVIASLRGLRT